MSTLNSACFHNQNSTVCTRSKAVVINLLAPEAEEFHKQLKNIRFI